MPGDDHWFEPIADHVGTSYLRYAHTKGTRQEVDHLVTALGLEPGMRVLDVGCGPGRHVHELARRGIAAHGIDISMRFVELARTGAPAIGGEPPGEPTPCESAFVSAAELAEQPKREPDRSERVDRPRRSLATFERRDARSMTFDREFDAAICLCQGAFGMMTAAGEDEAVLAGIARALRPGGALALTAFNAYFAVKYHEGARFDATAGVSHERTTVHDEQGVPTEVDLWTGCYTPRELRLLLDRAGCDVTGVTSVEPGRYGDAEASTESPEFLVVARAVGGEPTPCGVAFVSSAELAEQAKRNLDAASDWTEPLHPLTRALRHHRC